MATLVHLYPDTITYGSTVFTGGNVKGGPLSIRIDLTVDDAESFTGKDIWATFMQATRRRLSIFIGIRDMSEFNTISVNDKESLVLLFSNERPADNKTFTITGMVAKGKNTSIDQAVAGEMEQEFSHESSDGQTNPITIT